MQFHHCFCFRVFGCLLGAALLTISAGCQVQSTDQETAPQEPVEPPLLRMVFIDAPELAQTIERQWKARTEGRLEVQQMPASELGSARQILGDVVIYPSECLGTMVQQNLIAPLTTDTRRDPQLALQDVLDLQRNAETRWGESIYAVSFGSPQFTLMYRADIFAELKMKPPTTWDAYQQLAGRLKREQLEELAPPADVPWSATIEPLADGWAGKTLLARAAAYAKAPSQFSALFDYLTMEPLIDGPPFVRAMQQLVTAARLRSDDSPRCTPSQAKQTLFAGQAAMIWGWPTAAPSAPTPSELPPGVQIGFAQLPGATQVYDFGEKEWLDRRSQDPAQIALIGIAGRLGSVTRNARHASEAANLLVWLSGKQWSAQIAPQSPATTLFRQSHLAEPALWTEDIIAPEAAEQYAELVSETQTQHSHLSSIRIPGWQQYLAALDQAVLDSVAGHQTPQQALTEAATQWRSITEELGLEQQRIAYTRSLGLEP